ncbi:hypothetical protein [Microbacterium pygmaeum]|uniref:hypothetical protein n=1 Tax=Microbacterium pygmaeum TaxID=370764 RepID=UPI0012F95CB2|nr:hypothetical protein [Microbacterium pygmaeum]
MGSLLIAGGAVQLVPLTIDYVALRAYAAVFLLPGVGFMLVLAGSVIAAFVFTPVWAWATFTFGAFLWFLSWSGPLFYYFVPVLPVWWAVAGTAACLVSVVVSVAYRKVTSAVISGILALGSIASVWLTFLSVEIISPDYIYAPFATGALIAGVICVASPCRAPALVRDAA